MQPRSIYTTRIGPIFEWLSQLSAVWEVWSTIKPPDGQTVNHTKEANTAETMTLRPIEQTSRLPSKMCHFMTCLHTGRYKRAWWHRRGGAYCTVIQ
jgi:hypothetical protein